MVHFGAVLLLSAALSAPWRGVDGPAVLCGLCGTAGVAYVVIVARRTRAQTDYAPVLEDWIFHVLLPAVAYLILVGAAYVVRSRAEPALFSIAASAFLLLAIGIHNAWDTVTYLVLTRGQE